MTTVQHHISDDFLMGYAAGVLPQAFDLVVGAHVSLSDFARDRLCKYESLGGAILENIDAVAVSDTCLDQTLTKIAGMVHAPETKQHDGIFPPVLHDAVGGDEAAVKWRALGRGVKQSILHSDKQGSVRLLSIPAGQAMPKHGHGGLEITLVLKGAYREDTTRFARGDVEIATKDTHHSPIAEQDEDCICLIATDAPLRFHGVWARMAQPFFKI